MLTIRIPKFYKVKAGQTLADVAAAFSFPERVIARENALTKEPYAGQILRLPSLRGNLYTVREGDSKRLLAGSVSAFEQKNAAGNLYPGRKVLI